ncbi:ABC transporter substrate-binding protein [Propionicicella superfundia]|uniref:ABC transporter substrate-binding protein n=1 Tax=Propionicicella superfundia TaxID=348582 RepID=UPI0003F62651|nr:ABC transporter substrate-binding protein [Propionicicella superfundia]
MGKLATGRLPGLMVAVAAALALVLTGCSPAASPTSAEKTLTVGATLEPPSLDPTTNSSASIPQLLLYNTYQTLVRLDNAGNLQPLLAQRWDISTDLLTYTFHLDPAAKFASGTAVTAEAAAKSIERIKDADTVSVWANQMEVVDSATAVDTHTLQVTLSRPSNNWLFNMASSAGIVIDPDGLSGLATQPAGSGPYVLDSWTRGDSITLKLNKSYWGTPPRYDKVVFRYFSDANAMNAAMLSGQLDIISNLQAPEAVSQFSDTSKYSVIRGTTNGEVVLGMNHDVAALSNLKVRQAIAAAIDKKALLETVWNGEGTLIGSMSVPTDPWYEDLTGVNPYDQAKAKKLLSEAGYASGLSLRLRVPATAYARKSAEFVASSLKQVGITVTIQELQFGVWYSDVFTKGDYDLTIVSHVEARDVFTFADPSYYWHYDNATFQKLVQQADEASSAQELPLMKQAVKLLATDVAADWLFALPNLVVTRAGITGVPQNATSLSFDVTTIASR